MTAAKSTAVRAVAAVAAAWCAAALLAGCGAAHGDTGEAAPAPAADPAVLLRGAADALVRAGSSAVGTSLQMASGGTWVTVTGSGRYDYAHGQGTLTLVLPRDAAGAQEHAPVTELLTPGALYMKNRGAGVPADKWVRVDIAALPDGNLVTGGATDPLVAAQLLRGVLDVRFAGTQDLGGEPVRHLAGTLGIAEAARASGARPPAALSAAAAGFAVGRVPFEAWLDGAGRLVRMTLRYAYGPARRTVEVVSTTTYSRFGAAVPPPALPPAADIWAGKIVSPPASG
ncbi:hypothetical protein [Streptomyces sp. NRRL F-5123]|uniref:hypothetical protein n=1 Tax=Streptomyces sp. NRRL F-5123 TaxID=1463856 RepID=UPI0004E183C1|nr:hypothetical protein [Streptomyces sp. NRRL F-5123]